jgi:preprotein translocase subunit SecG
MIAVLLMIHLFLALAMIGVILLQRSEGGALGIGGGSMGGLMTSRGSANLLTKATAYLATAFMITSLSLAILAGEGRQAPSIITEPVAPATSEPAIPAAPSVPVAR